MYFFVFIHIIAILKINCSVCTNGNDICDNLRTYNFSIRIDDAPPPPLQIDATPFSPALSTCAKCTMIRAPDML